MRPRSYKEEFFTISPGVSHLLQVVSGQAVGAWQPPLDVYETKDVFVIVLDVPGVSGDKIDITFESGVLTVQGERKFHSGVSEDSFHRVERRFGRFSRRIGLPPGQLDPDGVTARVADGVLTVEVPKIVAAQPRRIKVIEQQTIESE